MADDKTERDLSDQEIAERERRVLEHFLTSKPERHKPLSDKPKRAPPNRKRSTAAAKNGSG